MIEDELCTVNIIDLDSRGLGLSKVEGTSVAVPFTLPGEEATIEVIHPKRREPWGKLLSVANPNPQRQKPPCRHFGKCGGCLLQHLSEDAYQKFKIQNLKSVLEQHGLPIDAPGETIFIGPHQRRRIDISGRMTEDGLVLGFHNINSKRPFTVDQCAVLHPKIETLFAPLRGLLETLLEEREKIHVFFTVADNGVDLMLAGLKRQFSGNGVQKLISFAQEHDLVRLVFKAKKRVTLYEREMPTIAFGGYPVEVASNAFLQASSKADKVLADLVIRNIPSHTKRVADLFCGRGTLSLPLVHAGYEVDGYECDEHALAALQATRAPGLRTFSRNLFEVPLSANELKDYDVVVLDPPRSGIKDQVISLGDAKVPRIIYVSCGLESFARDGAALLKRGYSLTQMNLVDQFIWTPHMEVVGVFELS